jgi:hypothetical protein
MPRIDPKWGALTPIDGELRPLPFHSEHFHGWGLILSPSCWALAWESTLEAPKQAEAPATVMGWGHGWTWALYSEASRGKGGRTRTITRDPTRLVLLPGSLIVLPPTPGYFWAEFAEKPIWSQEIGHALRPAPPGVEHNTRPVVDQEVKAYLEAHPNATRLDVYRDLHRTQLSVRASLNRLGYRVPGR